MCYKIKLHKRPGRILLYSLAATGILLLWCGLWLAGLPKPSLLQNLAFSTKVLDREGELLRLGLTRDHKFRIFTPLEQIAPELIEATLLYEDRYFYIHFGVNPISLARAAWSTYISGERRIGASTLTMQVARLLHDFNTSTIWGKLRQIKLALALERHYSKREILEAYFNLAPYGGNIEGIGAAARIYFQTSARQLTLTESLSLVGVPQNPARRNPLRAPAQSDPENQEHYRARLSRIWLEAHPEDADNAFFHHLPLSVHGPTALPFNAPHVSAEALASAGLSKNSRTGTEKTNSPASSMPGRSSDEIIRTTIDSRKQNLLQSRIDGFIARRSREGIRNACAVLLHWPSMEVKALAGSADFHNQIIQGQVDGTRARRSPGSTLKPFIYALALDQGLIHPRTLLYDTPRAFKGYEPENSDGRFHGPLTAADALAQSRNIPAIALANRLLSPDLYSFLSRAHADLPRGREEYGLSLVLGGAETTPRHLAALYALLANKGVWKEPVLFKDDKNGFLPGNSSSEAVSPGTALLSPEAAALTLHMLRDNSSARRAHYTGQDASKLPVYWKTGTSNGYRDAWSAGVFGPYVFVAWVGNFDGKPNMAFVGADSAADLFWDMVEGLDATENLRDTALAHMPDLNLAKIPVCADTGDIDVRLCPETVYSWFIPGVSPVADSGIYRKILIDADTGLRACKETEKNRTEVWAFWPSDLQRMFRQAGVSKKPPPPFSPECAGEIPQSAVSKGVPPQILSPKERLIYIRGVSGRDNARIALQARADADVRALFWFYGTKFIGQTAPGERLHWTPPGGKGLIRVLDDFGRADSREITVELGP